MVVELGFEPKSCSSNFTGFLLPGVLAAHPFDLLTSAYVNGNQLLGVVLPELTHWDVAALGSR